MPGAGQVYTRKKRERRTENNNTGNRMRTSTQRLDAYHERVKRTASAAVERATIGECASVRERSRNSTPIQEVSRATEHTKSYNTATTTRKNERIKQQHRMNIKTKKRNIKKSINEHLLRTQQKFCFSFFFFFWILVDTQKTKWPSESEPWTNEPQERQITIERAVVLARARDRDCWAAVVLWFVHICYVFYFFFLLLLRRDWLAHTV